MLLELLYAGYRNSKCRFHSRETGLWCWYCHTYRARERGAKFGIGPFVVALIASLGGSIVSARLFSKLFPQQ